MTLTDARTAAERQLGRWHARQHPDCANVELGITEWQQVDPWGRDHGTGWQVACDAGHTHSVVWAGA